jgi:hypothetical protein
VREIFYTRNKDFHHITIWRASCGETEEPDQGLSGEEPTGSGWSSFSSYFARHLFSAVTFGGRGWSTDQTKIALTFNKKTTHAASG